MASVWPKSFLRAARKKTQVNFFTSGTGATINAPFTGRVFIRLWSNGVNGSAGEPGAGGRSGSYSEIKVNVTSGNTFTYTIADTSTVTCPSPSVNLSCQSTASGGDTNIDSNPGGSAGSSSGGNGGTAPSSLVQGPYPIGGSGGAGGSKNNNGSPGQKPGGGGGGDGKNGSTGGAGAVGMVVFIWQET